MGCVSKLSRCCLVRQKLKLSKVLRGPTVSDSKIYAPRENCGANTVESKDVKDLMSTDAVRWLLLVRSGRLDLNASLDVAFIRDPFIRDSLVAIAAGIC